MLDRVAADRVTVDGLLRQASRDTPVFEVSGGVGPLHGARPHTQVRRVYGEEVCGPPVPVGSEGLYEDYA